MNYSNKLKDPRWQKKRLQILERDSFTCVVCSDKSTELHVHHSKYSGDPWEADDEFLDTVCAHCHSMIHWFGNENDISKMRSKSIKVLHSDQTSILILIGTKGTAIFSIKESDNSVELISVLENNHFLKISELIKNI